MEDFWYNFCDAAPTYEEVQTPNAQIAHGIFNFNLTTTRIDRVVFFTFQQSSRRGRAVPGAKKNERAFKYDYIEEA